MNILNYFREEIKEEYSWGCLEDLKRLHELETGRKWRKGNFIYILNYKFDLLIIALMGLSFGACWGFYELFMEKL